MKLLLDEQIDVRMKPLLREFKVYTLHDFDWLGLQNGALREQVNQNGFDALVSADKNMPFQQNLSKVNFALVLLDTPSLLFANQIQFVPKLTEFFRNPPSPLPKIVHISVDGLSIGSKKSALIKLVGAEHILFV